MGGVSLRCFRLQENHGCLEMPLTEKESSCPRNGHLPWHTLTTVHTTRLLNHMLTGVVLLDRVQNEQTLGGISSLYQYAR